MQVEATENSRSGRQSWMAVLARADRAALDELLAAVGPLPAHSVVKAPEVGTVMIEARAGGTGRRFNLGEATVTRAVVRLADGTLGFSYALGTDTAKARTAAVLDAMLQSDASRPGLIARIIAPLEQAQIEARELRSRKAAATKVEFFTLSRERT